MSVVLFKLKAQNVCSVAIGCLFKTITKTKLDDAVMESGIMGIVLFISTAVFALYGLSLATEPIANDSE